MPNSEKAVIATMDEIIKEHFADELSALYKNFHLKSYDSIAEAASKKTSFAHLPVNMLIYVLQNVSIVKFDKKAFELLNYSGCREYKRINCEKASEIIELINNIQLEPPHIASLSTFIINTLFVNKNLNDGLFLLELLFENNKAYTKRCISSKLSYFLRFKAVDIKLSSVDIQRIISVVEKHNGASKELSTTIKSVQNDLISIETRNILNDITKKAFPKLKHSWNEYFSWEKDDILFLCIDEAPLDSYVNDNFEQALSVLLNTADTTTEISRKKLIKKITIALANKLVDRWSDIEQNKALTVCQLYNTSPTFKEATKEYAIYAPRLLSILFVHSFFLMDEETVTDVYKNCIVQYNKNPKEKTKLLEYISDELRYNHDFYELVTLENCNLYWDISKQIDSIFPELHFYETADGEKLIKIKSKIDDFNLIKSLQDNMSNGYYWIDTTPLPEYLEFKYLYPNGSNGDMLKYILEEYGHTEQFSALEWYGKISKQHIDMLELLAAPAQFISSDINFLNIYEYHIPSIIRKKASELPYHIGAVAVKQNIFDFLSEHGLEQKQKRSELYSKLIIEERTTPKWKSEAQLYALTAAVYPDAVYQYRAKWLGMQSLDIYIPSLSIGIEYQGIQHYHPIEHFGGENHFKHQQMNDKKKSDLCKKNGIHLIEWSYQEPISEKLLKEKINEIKKKNKRK